MNIAFSIEPYVGPLPLRFGMTPGEVEALIGPRLSILPNPFGHRHEQREKLNLAFSDNGLIETVFLPGAAVFFEERNIFEHPDPIGFLRQFDRSPFLWVGLLVFVNLGIQLSGFHDNDESQKSIAVVNKGYWDEYAAGFVPYV